MPRLLLHHVLPGVAFGVYFIYVSIILLFFNVFISMLFKLFISILFKLFSICIFYLYFIARRDRPDEDVELGADEELLDAVAPLHRRVAVPVPESQRPRHVDLQI